jgi:hypothetical protein
MIQYGYGVPIVNYRYRTKLERATSESIVPAIKFLGAFIDPMLNFKYHVPG